MCISPQVWVYHIFIFICIFIYIYILNVVGWWFDVFGSGWIRWHHASSSSSGIFFCEDDLLLGKFGSTMCYDAFNFMANLFQAKSPPSWDGKWFPKIKTRNIKTHPSRSSWWDENLACFLSEEAFPGYNVVRTCYTNNKTLLNRLYMGIAIWDLHPLTTVFLGPL